MSTEMEEDVALLVSRLILAHGDQDRINEVIRADFGGIRNVKAARKAGEVMRALLLVFERVLDSHPHRDYFMENFRVRHEFDAMTKDLDSTKGLES